MRLNDSNCIPKINRIKIIYEFFFTKSYQPKYETSSTCKTQG